MSNEREDETSIAFTIAHFLNSPAPLAGAGDGWEARGLDLGEVEIDCPNGQKFRLIVEEIEDEE